MGCTSCPGSGTPKLKTPASECSYQGAVVEPSAGNQMELPFPAMERPTEAVKVFGVVTNRTLRQMS